MMTDIKVLVVTPGEEVDLNREPDILLQWPGPRLPAAGDLISLEYGGRESTEQLSVLRYGWTVKEDGGVDFVMLCADPASTWG